MPTRGRLTNRIAISVTDALTEHHGRLDPDPADPTDRLAAIVDRSAAEEMSIEL